MAYKGLEGVNIQEASETVRSVYLTLIAVGFLGGIGTTVSVGLVLSK
jgi:hypothetical protein